MDYTDFLPDSPYDDLPPGIRATISRTDYEERRALANELNEPAAQLPEALQQAFSAATTTNKQARTQDAMKVERASKVRWLPWLAAAGWLLFLTTGLWGILRPAPPLLVEKPLLAPASAPIIEYRTEVIYQTDTLYLMQDRWRTRIVRDTVVREIASPPVLVEVRDTVYLPEVEPVVIANGESLQGRKRLLRLLFSAED